SCRRPGSCRGGHRAGVAGLGEKAAFGVLALLADVETGNRAVIAHHAGPDFAALALFVTQTGLIGSGIHRGAPWLIGGCGKGRFPGCRQSTAASTRCFRASLSSS